MADVRNTHDWRWYDYLESIKKDDPPLLQGDYIRDCPVIVHPKDIPIKRDMTKTEITVEVERFDIVVLSQSCDCAFRGKIKFVLAAPAYPLSEYEESSGRLKARLAGFDEEQKAMFREQIRQGNILGYHLINSCEYDDCGVDEPSIIDFHNLLSIEQGFLINFSKNENRLRLLPPYREQLAHSFAHYISRVGLPNGREIQPFFVKGKN